MYPHTGIQFMQPPKLDCEDGPHSRTWAGKEADTLLCCHAHALLIVLYGHPFVHLLPRFPTEILFSWLVLLVPMSGFTSVQLSCSLIHSFPLNCLHTRFFTHPEEIVTPLSLQTILNSKEKHSSA